MPAPPLDPTPAASTTPSPLPKVFCVHGADPEVQAYAMAKYSRSSLSMKETLAELNEQKAEKFLNTFYFQYGHRSIADLAHLAMAIERLSLLAATIVVDEQRWDGQERSTRYQDFKKSGYYVPDFGDAALEHSYRETIDFLFAEYREISEAMFQHLVAQTPRPEDMKQDAYERTLRARAFDISRYLLPLATNTSLGQIVNARTLETQVSRLLSHTHAEVRQLGQLMKDSAREPGLQRESRCLPRVGRGHPHPGFETRRRGPAAALARRSLFSHAGQIRRAERLRDRHPRRNFAKLQRS
jgi:thymidylate synthase ThyX